MAKESWELPRDPEERPRVNKAFVVMELADGSAMAYAIEQPVDVYLDIEHDYPERNDWFGPLIGTALHSLDFEFKYALRYTMVHMAPGTWGGFKFDTPAIEAGESRD